MKNLTTTKLASISGGCLAPSSSFDCPVTGPTIFFPTLPFPVLGGGYL